MTRHSTITDGNRTIISVFCTQCAERKEFTVATAHYNAWAVDGQHIQDAMPEVPADDREILISGVCGLCFDRMFAEDDEDDVTFLGLI